MRRASHVRVLLLGLAGMLMTAQVGAETAAAWQFSGDLRFGYFHEKRDPRTGPSSRNDEGRMRLRIAVDGALAENWKARARLAGRYSTNAGPEKFYLRFDAPTRSGARFGDTTFDELYLQRRAHDGSWQIRAGRFHSGVNLLGVAGKALDRKDFPNVGINWTDGVQVELDLADGWRGRFELQYNDRAGIGQATEAPLDFSRGGSRVGTYTALVGAADGIWAQRMLAVTWFPNALAAQGIAEAARKDYVALDGKLAAAWPLGDAGMRLLLGGEVGFAPNRPDRSVLATGGSGRADGLAWQISANLLDMAPGHNIGVVYARIGAGWLLSPDFRGNDALAEARYQWRFTPRWSMEARYRIREEIKIPVTAPRERQDTDFYIRLTGRF